MFWLVILLVTVLLFGGFLLLTHYEGGRGVRVANLHREGLDQWVGHIVFIGTHVDFESFLREQVRALAARIAHDVAHLSLLTIRAVERLLTRLVKHLRIRHEAQAVVAGSPRAFVQAMSDFKKELAATPFEAPAIDEQKVV